MAETPKQAIEKNIFEQVQPNSKIKKVVKKKRKKQAMQTEDDMMGKMTAGPISPKKSAKMQSNVKSFEEMIAQAKKPVRMPPPNTPSILLQQQSEQQSEEEVLEQLIFHKPSANILTMKNRNRKKLFDWEENEQFLQEQDEEQEQVYNKLRGGRNQKVQGKKKKKEVVQIIKPKTKQQIMIQNLKVKYAQPEQPYYQQAQPSPFYFP